MQLTHVDQSHWDFRSIGAAHGQMGIFTAIWFFSRPYGVFHGHVFFFTAILGCHGHMLKRLMAGEEAIKQPSRIAVDCEWSVAPEARYPLLSTTVAPPGPSNPPKMCASLNDAFALSAIGVSGQILDVCLTCCEEKLCTCQWTDGFCDRWDISITAWSVTYSEPC